jgi:hypothetical protein
MSSELLFINITEAISAVSFLFGCNMVLTYSLFRQELPFGNIFTPFKVMKGFSKKEWILFILLIINSAIFAIISMNAHNFYLHKYGAKPDTWLF